MGRARRAAMTLSALSFGMLGWCTAHALTWWLVTHQHVVDGVAVTHDHPGWLRSAAVLAGCVAVAALLAMFFVSWRPDRVPHPRPADRRHDLRRAAALTAGAYLTAELAESQLTGDHRLPGALVLLIGAGIYLMAGAGVAKLWRGSTHVIQRMAVRFARTPRLASRGSRRIALAAQPAALACQQWASAIIGRGPPALPV